jgi:hypothetical protein
LTLPRFGLRGWALSEANGVISETVESRAGVFAFVFTMAGRWPGEAGRGEGDSAV